VLFYLSSNPRVVAVCAEFASDAGHQRLVCFTACSWVLLHRGAECADPALAGYFPIMVSSSFHCYGTVLEIKMIARKRYRLAAVTYVIRTCFEWPFWSSGPCDPES